MNHYIHSTQLQQRGVSLIEVLISLIIISAGFLSISKFQAQLFQSASVATQRSEAQAHAQQIIDAYRASRQTTLTTVATTCPITGTNACTSSWLAPTTGTPTALDSPSGNSYTTTWKMSSTPTSSTASTQKLVYRTEVTVTWVNPQGTQKHTAYALIVPNA